MNCECKHSPLTAMWQVEVPQIIAMRAVIGRSSQGRLNPFTSAPRTPAKRKKNADINHIISILQDINVVHGPKKESGILFVKLSWVKNEHFSVSAGWGRHISLTGVTAKTAACFNL